MGWLTGGQLGNGNATTVKQQHDEGVSPNATGIDQPPGVDCQGDGDPARTHIEPVSSREAVRTGLCLAQGVPTARQDWEKLPNSPVTQRAAGKQANGKTGKKLGKGPELRQRSHQSPRLVPHWAAKALVTAVFALGLAAKAAASVAEEKPRVTEPARTLALKAWELKSSW